MIKKHKRIIGRTIRKFKINAMFIDLDIYKKIYHIIICDENNYDVYDYYMDKTQKLLSSWNLNKAQKKLARTLIRGIMRKSKCLFYGKTYQTHGICETFDFDYCFKWKDIVLR